MLHRGKRDLFPTAVLVGNNAKLQLRSKEVAQEVVVGAVRPFDGEPAFGRDDPLGDGSWYLHTERKFFAVGAAPATRRRGRRL